MAKTGTKSVMSTSVIRTHKYFADLLIFLFKMLLGRAHMMFILIIQIFHTREETIIHTITQSALEMNNL